MVVVAQLVRAPDCGSGGRRFEPGLPPLKLLFMRGFFFYTYIFKFKIDEKSIFIICSFASFMFAPKE